MFRNKLLVAFFNILLYANAYAADVVLQVEDMQTGGPYAGVIDSPFRGVGLYANGDKVSGNANFSSLPGEYRVELRGASSSEGVNAGVNLIVDGAQIAAFNFTSTSAAIKTAKFVLRTGSTNKPIELVMTNDTGASDTFLDRVSFRYLGTPPPTRPNPIIPVQGAFFTGNYRNMFVESGKSASAVDAKFDQIWNQYFVNGSPQSERLFYEVGTDMGYILDANNNDIRSEGMSYGMMICVQRAAAGNNAQNREAKEKFDRLWKFAKTYSQHPPGTAREGLFAWDLEVSNFRPQGEGEKNSAPDGEEYYVTALFFADKLWGSTKGNGSFNPTQDIFDYRGQANYILRNMVNKPAWNSGQCPTNLVNTDDKQVVFGICGNSATYTDPSYHLPAFYEIWAREADNNRQLWADMASVSRTYLLPRAAHPDAGLMADYSEYDGTPKNVGTHGNFEFDAWRNIMNMGFDFHWFQKEKSTIQQLISKQIDFFKDKPNYPGLWEIYNFGTNSWKTPRSRNTDHNSGLVACNAVGALSLADAKVWPFVDELFELAIPSGQYRYYDGMLYMMSFMHLAGKFKALSTGTGTPPCSPPTATLTKKDAASNGAGKGSITITFPDVSGQAIVEFSIDGGSTYPRSVADNSGSTTFGNLTVSRYDVWARWGNGTKCPVRIGSITIAQDGGGSGAVIQAESNHENFYQLNNNNGVIDNISYAHWLKFNNVDISGGKFTYRYSKGNNENGYMKVRIDNNSDQANLAEIYSPNTGGWSNYQERTVSINGTGTHTVYLYFHNASKNINLDWIKFGAESTKLAGQYSSLNQQNEPKIISKPSEKLFIVTIPNESKPATVVVIDMMGKVVHRQYTNNKKTVAISGLSSGIYALLIANDGKWHTIKAKL